MNILIIVKWYPPDIHVAARRWANLVQHLTEQGARCTIITAGGTSISPTTGPYGEKIVRLPVSNAVRPPLPADGGTRPTLKRKIARGISWLTPSVVRGLRSNRWDRFLRIHPELGNMAHAADVIVTSFPPIGPLLLGKELARSFRKPWVVDLRDSFEAFDEKTFPLSRLIGRLIEGRLIKSADTRLTISSKLAEYMSSLYEQKFEAVYNGWVDEDRVESSGPSSAPPYLYYAGTFYHYSVRGLSYILKAMEEHPALRLKMRVLRDKSGKLQAMLEPLVASGRAEILPPADTETVSRELSGAAGALVLENLEDFRPFQLGTVTGKLLGLLASGIPGIAVSRAEGEIRSLVNATPGWYGVDDQESCNQALSRLLESGPRRPLAEGLQDYHVKRQAERLFHLLDAPLGRKQAIS